MEEHVVVVDANAVHYYSAVVVVLYAALVAVAAVVHPGALENLARVAILECSIVSHAIVYAIAWSKRIEVNNFVHFVCECELELICLVANLLLILQLCHQPREP